MKQLKEYILTENNFFKNLGIGQKVQIEKWLDEFLIDNYTINPDLTIDVNDDIELSFYEEVQLPEYIQFGTVTGDFSLTESKVTTLRGCPVKVGGNFECVNCKNLISLKGAPKEVGGDFECGYCPKLTSLEGAPEKIGKDFDCGYCTELKSLKGIPKIIPANFYCTNCFELKSLRGAPKEVGGCFDCRYCDRWFDNDDVKKVSKVKGIILV